MRAKIGVVIAGTALAIFAMGRAESLIAGRGCASPLAWAQESDDQTEDAVSPDDASSQDDAASQDNADLQDDADSPNTTAGPASGVYSGTVMDNNMGAGKIQAALTQLHSKLSGVWQDTFVPPAFWKGTISSSGKISARMRFHLTGKCGYVFNGVFQNGNEISGHYTLNGCKGMAADSGTFQMTKQ